MKIILTLLVLCRVASAQVSPVPVTDQTLTGKASFSSPLGVRLATGSGLSTGGGVGGLKLLPCTITGQVLQWNGTGYACNGTLMTDTNGQVVTFSSYTGSSGSNNIWIGGGGASDTSGANNSAFGVNTLFSNTTGVSNVAIGINSMALNTTGSQNTAAGGSALTANTTGSTNSAIGASALASNTTGSNNTGLGVSALQHNTTGDNNTAAGVNALITNTTGINNAAFGINALASDLTGNTNSAFGAGALELDTGDANSAFGFNAMINNTTGHDNVAIGSGALGANTTGTFNTAVGGNASGANTTATHNIAIGQDALATNTTGNFIIALGLHALQDLNVVDSSDNYNLAIGYNTARGITTGTANTIIGHNVTGLSPTLSGQIIIADGNGNKRIQVDSSAHTTLAGNVQIMATGATWTSGTGVPAIACAKGDEFSRTDGGVGSTHYNCTATNTWTAVSASTGTVTSVATGTGLTGGTITTTGTLSLNINGGSTQTCGAGTAVTSLTGVGVTGCTAFGSSSLTNGAGNNVLTKSNGTNLVASAESDDGTNFGTSEQMIFGHSGAVSYTSLTSSGVLNYNSTSGILTLAAQSAGGSTEIDLAVSNAGNAAMRLSVTPTLITLNTASITSNGAIAMSSHKITGITDGSSAQDVPAFHQIADTVNAAVSGTSGRSARFSGTNATGNGAFTDDGTNATIGGTFGVTGAATDSSTLHLVGVGTFDSDLSVAGVTTLNGITNATGGLNVTAGGKFSYSGRIQDSGTQFTVASCGSGTSQIQQGGATSGTITIGATGTGCTITFGVALAHNATCLVTERASTKTAGYTTSASQLSITSATAGNTYDFFCESTP